MTFDANQTPESVLSGLLAEIADLKTELAFVKGNAIGAEAEIADLKQQLHAYREYHDARDRYESMTAISPMWGQSSMGREQFDKICKANAALQILRNSKGN